MDSPEIGGDSGEETSIDSGDESVSDSETVRGKEADNEEEE